MVTYTVRITKGDKLVRGDYHGGAYIDLTFGTFAAGRPTEVINVWDYENGRVHDSALASEVRPLVIAAVRKEILEWMVEQDEEWPSWYEDYIANARY